MKKHIYIYIYIYTHVFRMLVYKLTETHAPRHINIIAPKYMHLETEELIMS